MLLDFGVLGCPEMKPQLWFQYEMSLPAQVLKFRALDCGSSFEVGRS